MKEANDGTVEIKDSEPNAVREFLRFLYAGKVERIDTIYLKLFELSHVYLVESLKTICMDYMVRHMNVTNVVDIFIVAKKYELPAVIERAKYVFST